MISYISVACLESCNSNTCDVFKCYDPLKMKWKFNNLRKICFANIVDNKCRTIKTLLNEIDSNLALNEEIINQAYSLSLKTQTIFKFVC